MSSATVQKVGGGWEECQRIRKKCGEKRAALADVGADCCFAGFGTNPIVQLDVIQYIKGTGSPDGLSFG
jgi:hypothetical protein